MPCLRATEIGGYPCKIPCLHGKCGETGTITLRRQRGSLVRTTTFPSVTDERRARIVSSTKGYDKNTDKMSVMFESKPYGIGGADKTGPGYIYEDRNVLKGHC